MDYFIKKDRLIRALKDAELYHIFDVTEENDFIVFQTQQNIKNGRCLISIALDDRIYNSIHFFLGNLGNPGKKQKMLDLMNDMNKEGLMVKYYLDEDDAIMARVTYITSNEEFDGDFFVSLISLAYNIIEEKHYPQIMRLIWS